MYGSVFYLQIWLQESHVFRAQQISPNEDQKEEENDDNILMNEKGLPTKKFMNLEIVSGHSRKTFI